MENWRLIILFVFMLFIGSINTKTSNVNCNEKIMDNNKSIIGEIHKEESCNKDNLKYKDIACMFVCI